ncbi:hypothetical protein GCM10009849_22200 [Sinomonas flava]|uniref:Uncharacterized protein n=1 Tax=Sinomonas flava TaxID=496857 RepID=A0ABP5NM80_9MICC
MEGAVPPGGLTTPPSRVHQFPALTLSGTREPLPNALGYATSAHRACGEPEPWAEGPRGANSRTRDGDDAYFAYPKRKGGWIDGARTRTYPQFIT